MKSDFAIDTASMLILTLITSHTNYAHHSSVTCLSDLMKHIIEALPITNAAGLTILYTQKNFTAEVYLSQSHFISNRGTLTGAVLVMYFNSVIYTVTDCHIKYHFQE